MASDIRWWRMASSLALTLLIFASALSLPLQNAYNEYADPQTAGGALTKDIPLPPSDDLTANAGNLVPATNSDQMFPANMPAPPPGALNDGGMLPGRGEQPIHAEDLIPPQPVDQETIGAPERNPLPPPMFPPNMPAPPPGAMNDAPVETGVPIPGESAAEYNIPLLPADNGGQMFPPNMPAPPPGAMADSALAELPVTVIQKNFPAPPANRGQMFPPNMPPPPPGAMAEPVMNPAITPKKASQFIAQAEPAANNGPATYQGAAPVAPKDSGSMFPPNMPPPPPGAYADPPPSPLGEQGYLPAQPSPMYRGAASQFAPAVSPSDAAASQFAPAVPPSDAAVEPVYLTGQTVPAEANPAPGGQSPYVDPTDLAYQHTANAGQKVSATGGSQWSPQVAQGPGATNAETSGNDATGESADTVVPPTDDESPESWELSESESSESDTVYANEDAYESGEDSYEESEDSVGAEEESYGSEEESESDYSFFDFWNSESDESSESDYFMNQEGSEESFASFNWLLDSSDDEFGYGESEESEWESNEESEWNSSEEELFEEAIEEALEFEEAIEHAIDEDNDANSPVDNQDFMPVIDEDFDPSRSKLILYCIPGVILSVLILLAWKNYSGKVRVVAISSDTDSKQYDWKSSYSTDEDRQPMLKQQEGDNY